MATKGFSAIINFKFNGNISVNGERIYDFNNGVLGSSNIVLGRYRTSNYLFCSFSNSSWTVLNSTRFLQNQIYTIALIYDPSIGDRGRISLFVDNELSSMYTPPIRAVDATVKNTYIGRSYVNNSFLQATVYTLRIYNFALTPAEASTYLKPTFQPTARQTFPSPIPSPLPTAVPSNQYAFTTLQLSRSSTIPTARMVGAGVSVTNSSFGFTRSGSNPYIDFGPQYFNIGSKGFAVAILFMFTGVAGLNERLIDFSNNGNGVDNIVLYREATSKQLAFSFKQNMKTVLTSSVFENFQVYDIVLNYDPTFGSNGLTSFYVDGVLSGTYVATYKHPDMQILNTWIGRSSYEFDSYLSAEIYSLTVYNRALSDAEAISITTQTKKPTSLPTAPPSPSPPQLSKYLFLNPFSSSPSKPIKNSAYNTMSSLNFARFGKNTYVDFGPMQVQVATLGFSIAAVFQFTGVPRFWEHIVEFNDGTQSTSLFLGRYKNSSQLCFGQSIRYYVLPGNFVQNRVYAVILSYYPSAVNNATLQFYVSEDPSTFISTIVYPAAIPTLSPMASVTNQNYIQTSLNLPDTTFQNIWIGRSSDPLNNYLSADIYSLDVYNLPISAYDVAAIVPLVVLTPSSAYPPPITNTTTTYYTPATNYSMGATTPLYVAFRNTYMDFGTNYINAFSNGFSFAVTFQFTSQNCWERLFDLNNGGYYDELSLSRNGCDNFLTFSINDINQRIVFNAFGTMYIYPYQIVSLVVTYQNINGVGSVKYYQNGLLLYTYGAAIHGDQLYRHTYVGCNNGGNQLLNGNIFSLSLFNRALSDSEALNLTSAFR